MLVHELFHKPSSTSTEKETWVQDDRDAFSSRKATTFSFLCGKSTRSVADILDIRMRYPYGSTDTDRPQMYSLTAQWFSDGLNHKCPQVRKSRFAEIPSRHGDTPRFQSLLWAVLHDLATPASGKPQVNKMKDIAAMCVSRPRHPHRAPVEPLDGPRRMEPIPNLEFSHYLDCPDVFAAINDSDDPFERMLAVIRFAATKDLQYIQGKDDPRLIVTSDDEPPVAQLLVTAPTTSFAPPESTLLILRPFHCRYQHAESDVSTQMSQLHLDGSSSPSEVEKLRVVYLTEQISHHPPVSAYYAACPSRHVELLGLDQISAKVAGTSVKVSLGAFNEGMLVNIPLTEEVGFYITISETAVITCTGGGHGQKFRTIIEYKEESWLGRAHFLIEGVIHTVFENETQHEEWTRIKDVPPSCVVAVCSYPAATSSSASSSNPSHTALPSPSNRSSSAASKADLTAGANSDYTTLVDLYTFRRTSSLYSQLPLLFPSQQWQPLPRLLNPPHLFPNRDMRDVKSVSAVDRSFSAPIGGEEPVLSAFSSFGSASVLASATASGFDTIFSAITVITAMFLVVGPIGSETAALSTPSTSSVTEGMSTSAAVTESTSSVSQAVVSSSPAIFSPTASASSSSLTLIPGGGISSEA
ncbi:hypothetical protein D9757_013383 [Collybiopsis confluens]|uniref:Oxysterol-binding protein n=1 Tax=Collybiopsis confluens TaxID=2823264 RepID=A0A8H5FQ14_9AGAR|nr:hypothetical protein D9757_013383 [Collybiopsis confluens]